MSGGGLDDVRARTEAAIKAVWCANRPVYLARVALLTAAAAALKAGRLSAEGRAEAADEAHKVAGAAGTFGFPEASAIARQIEAMLRAEGTLPAAAGDRLAGLAEALRDQLDPRQDA